MTTIATDGRTIAADGLATNNWMIASKSVRKIMVGVNEKGEPAVFAITGAYAMLDVLIKWVEGGRQGDPPRCAGEASWSLLVIDADGSRKIEAEHPYPMQVPARFAMGTGRDFATTALDMGASPLLAVEMACKRDVWSGGEIQVVDIAEALGQGAKPLSVAAE